MLPHRFPAVRNNKFAALVRHKARSAESRIRPTVITFGLLKPADYGAGMVAETCSEYPLCWLEESTEVST